MSLINILSKRIKKEHRSPAGKHTISHSLHRNQLPRARKHADFFLLFAVFILTVFGLIMVYDASVVEAAEQFGDRFHYVKYQGLYAGLGFMLFLIAGHIDYHRYRGIVKWLFAGNVLFLLLVLIPGVGLSIKGARRWIDFGFTTYQPSETFKTIVVLYLAKWLEKSRSMVQFFTFVVLILTLIILQPDLGTSIVLIATAFVMYYVSGAPLKQFALTSFIAFLLGLMLILTSPYRKERLMTYLTNSSDSLGSSYHIQQVLISLGSGGVWGVGIGQSLQKYRYVPEAMSDSIFAIIGEELGFFGTGTFILMYMLVIWRGLKIAQQSQDVFGRLLALGITTWIGAQTCVNLASMVSLVPLTGVPLPLVSYGGTSLVVTLVSFGILLNISRQKV